MSSTTISAHNPFKHKFVLKLMNEIDEDDELHRRRQGKDMPPRTFLKDLAFMVLNLCTLVIVALYLGAGVTGSGWDHSIKSISQKESGRQLIMEEPSLTLERKFKMGRASILLIIDCFIIFLGTLISSHSVYMAAKRPLLWSFLLLMIGIPLEILISITADILTEKYCNEIEFQKKLEELLNISKHGMIDDSATLVAIKKINALQFSIGCCGITKGPQDYYDYGFDEPPSSCCQPAWAQNLYCANNIFNKAQQKINSPRLNPMGCVPMSTKLCQDVFNLFDICIKILFCLRILIVTLQGIILYYLIQSYRIIKTTGSIDPINQLKSYNENFALNFDSNGVSSSEITTSDGDNDDESKPKKTISKIKQEDEANLKLKAVATQNYLQVLASKGHGLAFNKELEAIEKRKREAERLELEKQWRDEADAALAAEEEEKKRKIKEAKDKKKNRKRNSTPKRIKKIIPTPPLIVSPAMSRHQELVKVKSEKEIEDFYISSLKELNQPVNPKSKNEIVQSHHHQPKHIHMGQQKQHHHDFKPNVAVKHGHSKLINTKEPIIHQQHHKKQHKQKKLKSHSPPSSGKIKSDIFNEPFLGQLESEQEIDNNIISDEDADDVGHEYVGGTGGLRSVSIEAVLNIPHHFSIFDESDDGDDDQKKKKKKKKMIKKKDNTFSNLKKRKGKPHAPRKSKIKPKRRYTNDEWNEFW